MGRFWGEWGCKENVHHKMVLAVSTYLRRPGVQKRAFLGPSETCSKAVPFLLGTLPLSPSPVTGSCASFGHHFTHQPFLITASQGHTVQLALFSAKGQELTMSSLEYPRKKSPTNLLTGADQLLSTPEHCICSLPFLSLLPPLSPEGLKNNYP